MTDKYMVVGNPVNHSKSPRIHELFARQCNQDMQYEARQLSTENFDHSILQFFKEGGKGLNVTVPFKEKAFQLADIVNNYARQAGAANTLWLDENQKIIAGNTDGTGLIKDLTENLKIDLSGKRILLLGAGGAVRGVLQPLIDCSPLDIHIYNRTQSKADQLADLFEHKITSVNRHQLSSPYDLIINGTASSLTGDIPDLPAGICHRNTISYDMMYSATETVFNVWARQQGAISGHDGLGMLVEQAAISFQLWRGILPHTAPVIKLLRQEMHPA